MPATVFHELKGYVRFDADDERRLRALHPLAAPAFQAIAEAFYARILVHQEAARILQGGESRVGRLKVTLVAWLDTLLRGPWDDAYWEHRKLIGQVHVRIGMPQHLMFGAMNVVRGELDRLAVARLPAGAELEATRTALSKILDLELAVMLHTYRDDLLAQQARVERLSTFGQLVASIGHDLRNPLGVIESSLFILRGRIAEDERARKHVDRIKEQVDLANGIITNLLDMIRDKPLAREPVRLATLAEDARGAVRRPAEVTVALLDLDDLPPVEGDPGQLRQVLVNLLENAVYAASPAGAVTLRGRREPEGVAVDVEDTGPGVDPATRRRLFEPLITTKERGIGLGLALCKRIAERHGGGISYADRAGGGARFTLRLPA
jgi:two-component system sensor histidine kinase HydH